MLTRPRMLLMDKPLAALDEARKTGILPYLQRLRDQIGMPILYGSHNTAEVARLGTQLLLIDAGRIAHHGPIDAFLADAAVAQVLGLRDAGAVLHARLIRHDDDGPSQLATSVGTLLLPHVDAPLGSALRIRILAQDVILSRHALNRAVRAQYPARRRHRSAHRLRPGQPCAIAQRQ